MNTIPTRESAWSLLCTYTQKTSLRLHALTVEAAMREMARHFGEDEEKWGIIGLVHDLDYEQFPEIHCDKTAEILRQEQWPEEYIRAVLAHGWGICTEVEPQSLMEISIYAVDELAGFIVACTLVRPDKDINEVVVSSIRKKWKKKEFAAGVDRQIVENGAEMLGIPLDDLMQLVLQGLQKEAENLRIGK